MANLPSHVIEQAKSSGLVPLIEGYGVKLAKQGADYFGLCPFHNEKSESFTVRPDKGFYHCFGCGAHGDPIAFVREFEGIGFRDAVQKLAGGLPADATPREKRDIEHAETEEWIAINPVPASAPAPKDVLNRKIGGNWQKLVGKQRWEYRNADGSLIGYVYRFDKPGGGKEVMPQVYCTNQQTGEMEWRWLSFPKPRPLYGLDKLARNPNAQVIVVEGEKTCDAAQVRFIEAGVPESKLVVVSWPGGGKAVKHADFSPLWGRRVGLWPDADLKTYIDKHPKAGELMPFLEQPGTIAMLDVFEAIRAKCEGVKFFVPPPGVPDGWDLADPFPDGFDLLAHAKTARLAENIHDEFSVSEPEPVLVEARADDIPPWEGKPNFPTPDEKARKPSNEGGSDDGRDDEEDGPARNGHFTILGYNRGEYFIFQHDQGQIQRCTKGDFTDAGLIELAPLNWWEANFSGGDKGGINKRAAQNFIMRTAEARGIYDIGRIRGRGAWIDEGRFVFHHGARLSVDGETTDITKIKSRYVYELDADLPEPADEPLSDEEGAQLLEVAKSFRWTKPGSAALLAGWVVLAPLCGALKWRPHIWCTGGAGSGKTTVLNEFVQPLMCGMEVFAQGNSSEAGIRQTLRADARPVLFDESEQNDEREKNRVQAIISLIRQASTESQARTLKGTAGGEAMSFHIRSMFCLASIQVGLKHQADMERLTVLALRPKRDDKDAAGTWEKIKAALYTIQRDRNLPAKLFRRSLDLLPIIRENIETFSAVAARRFGSQREGDQYGTLLAGTWALTSSALVTFPEAEAMIDSYDWSEHVENNETDEAQRALAALMESHVRLNGIEVTVHELVRAAANAPTEVVDLASPKANAILERHGMKVRNNRLLFSNNSNELKRLMEGTSFEADLRGVLLRLEGADRFGNLTVKFNGVPGKCISLPLDPLIDDDVRSPTISYSNETEEF
jgi:hypothetical protein